MSYTRARRYANYKRGKNSTKKMIIPLEREQTKSKGPDPQPSDTKKGRPQKQTQIAPA